MELFSEQDTNQGAIPLTGRRRVVERGFPVEKTSELWRKRNGAPGRENGVDKYTRAGKPTGCIGRKIELGIVRI